MFAQNERFAAVVTASAVLLALCAPARATMPAMSSGMRDAAAAMGDRVTISSRYTSRLGFGTGGSPYMSSHPTTSGSGDTAETDTTKGGATLRSYFLTGSSGSGHGASSTGGTSGAASGGSGGSR